MSRYRAEIRADLAERYPGVDLSTWWRERRFRALLELIDQLPSASRLNEAIQNDPEQAEIIALHIEEQKRKAAETGAEQSPWSPRVAEYDLHANLLRDLSHATLGLRAAVIASDRGEPGQTPDYPAPLAAAATGTARLERAWAHSVLERFGFDPEDF